MLFRSQVIGIGPGSPASKAFAREFLRLVGVLSLETVMDIADQTPPQPPPKMLEVQAKVQAKMAETKMKLQGKQQEQQIKLAGMKQGLVMKQTQNQMDLQKKVLEQILHQARMATTPPPGQGGENGGRP